MEVNAIATKVKLIVNVDSVAKEFDSAMVELNLVMVHLDLTMTQLISLVAMLIRQSLALASSFFVSRTRLPSKQVRGGEPPASVPSVPLILTY